MQVFLDSSVIIICFEIKESNSAKILDLVFDGKIEVFTSEKVLLEVREYFKKRRNRNFSFLIETLIRKNAKVIKRADLLAEMEKWKGKIKEKDLEQLAAIKALSIEYLIALDRDFKPFQEYKTPKQLLKLLGLKAKGTEY